MGRRILFCTVSDLGVANASSIRVVELVRAFAASAHSVTLVAPRPFGGFDVAGSLTDPRIRIRYLPSLRRLGLPNGANALIQVFPVLIACWRVRPDFVYIRTGTLSFPLTLAVRLLGRTSVWVEHNGWMEEDARTLGHPHFACRALRRSQRLDAMAATRVRAITAGIGEKLRDSGVSAAKIVVIGNGTNRSHFTAMERNEVLLRHSLGANRNYLGFIGNLAPWQGVDVAIKAFRLLAGAFPNWRPLVAGGGPEADRLTAAARDAALSDRIQFLGPVAYSKAPGVINAFDIALAPFRWARNTTIGLSPLKVRDYAACGRPVVAADVPGIRENSEPSWLLVHKADSPEDLARTSSGLMSDPAKRAAMGAAARTFAATHFGWEHVVARIVAAAEGLREGRVPRRRER